MRRPSPERLLALAGLLSCLAGPVGFAEPAEPLCAQSPSPSTPQLEPAASSAKRVQTEPLHLFLVGDVMLGNLAQETLDDEGYDYPFRALRPLFQDADLIVGNLEAPLTRLSEELDPDKEYVYKAKPRCAKSLREFGFSMFSLANNHSLDYGVAGLKDTLSALDEEGILHFGAGRSGAAATAGTIVERCGIRVGFLGFMAPYGPYENKYDYFAHGESPGIARMDEATMRAAVARLRPEVDVLVACVHWGENYEPVSEEQRKLGQLTAVLGFDLVFGHHPHVAQGVEVHGNVPVLYSLGNFTFCTNGRFAQLEDTRWHHGWIADVLIEAGRVRQVDLIPIDVDNEVVRFQPRRSDPALLPGLIEFLNADFGTRMRVVGDRARLELPGG
jgi:poly-gamma-glutamate capsule biosynthesis protein CapA/YwtB (metallophosphatase superfamily)